MELASRPVRAPDVLALAGDMYEFFRSQTRASDETGAVHQLEDGANARRNDHAEETVDFVGL
jgi:hypothetical protein